MKNESQLKRIDAFINALDEAHKAFVLDEVMATDVGAGTNTGCTNSDEKSCSDNAGCTNKGVCGSSTNTSNCVNVGSDKPIIQNPNEKMCKVN